MGFEIAVVQYAFIVSLNTCGWQSRPSRSLMSRQISLKYCLTRQPAAATTLTFDEFLHGTERIHLNVGQQVGTVGPRYVYQHGVDRNRLWLE
mmetsp:Transcript_28996/g.42607  ORF Transcript_28996/g.42607 Transcript_28996/m.42607 type:complete len:92 (+) Transcript_28996:1704-1979(+)